LTKDEPGPGLPTRMNRRVSFHTRECDYYAQLDPQAWLQGLMGK
jgi:hypothetical protein